MKSSLFSAPLIFFLIISCVILILDPYMAFPFDTAISCIIFGEISGAPMPRLIVSSRKLTRVPAWEVGKTVSRVGC